MRGIDRETQSLAIRELVFLRKAQAELRIRAEKLNRHEPTQLVGR